MRGHTRRNEAVTSGCARRVQIVVTTMVGVRVAMCSGDVHLRIPPVDQNLMGAKVKTSRGMKTDLFVWGRPDEGVMVNRLSGFAAGL